MTPKKKIAITVLILMYGLIFWALPTAMCGSIAASLIIHVIGGITGLATWALTVLTD